MPDLSLVYVTAASREAAEALARELVAQRLAACANILPGMVSIYHWKGAIETASECVLILKTRTALVEALTARILECHDYETPCVMALPIQSGAKDYLDWLASETRSA